jgi:hypothetical protein
MGASSLFLVTPTLFVAAALARLALDVALSSTDLVMEVFLARGASPSTLARDSGVFSLSPEAMPSSVSAEGPAPFLADERVRDVLASEVIVVGVLVPVPLLVAAERMTTAGWPELSGIVVSSSSSLTSAEAVLVRVLRLTRVAVGATSSVAPSSGTGVERVALRVTAAGVLVGTEVADLSLIALRRVSAESASSPS